MTPAQREELAHLARWAEQAHMLAMAAIKRASDSARLQAEIMKQMAAFK